MLIIFVLITCGLRCGSSHKQVNDTDMPMMIEEARSIDTVTTEPLSPIVQETWDCGEAPGTVTCALYDDGTFRVSGSGAMEAWGYPLDGVYAGAIGNKLISPPPWCDFTERIIVIIIEDGVTSIGNEAFSGCINLNSVIISNSVITIGNKAFFYCINLESVIIPNSVTRIGRGAFAECGFTSITLPNSVTIIENAAFYSCGRLKTITIPNSVKTIERDMFAYCFDLTSVTIGSGVTTIKIGAFSNCTYLTSIILLNPVPITDVAFTGEIVLDVNGEEVETYHAFSGIENPCLYVPESSPDAYRAADGWKDFECIKPLSAAPQD